MEYIKNCDYDYIMNKYHHQEELFEDNSGKRSEDIIADIRRQDAEIKTLAHPLRKAKAFAYVLKNVRIACDKRDIFPTLGIMDRLISKTIVADWKKEVFNTVIPEVEKKRAYLEQNGIVTIWPDYDHSVPVWDRIFDLGFWGLLKESERIRSQKDSLTEAQKNFYEGINITYTAIIDFIERLENQAKKQENIRLEKALANIKKDAPQTFYEALLVDYIYFMLSEYVEGLQVRSLGNFDRLFYRFYKKDLSKGVSEDQIRTDLAYFFLQFTSIGNYWNQPVFLGGCKSDESTEINELSYLFLDVYDKMKIYNPKIQIKIADSTPKKFVLKALDMIRRGNNCIAFVNDDTIRTALEKTGVTSEQARLCNVKGCYEYSIQGAMETGMNYMNLLKPLEFALHEGCDGVTGSFVGLISPKTEKYDSFEAFFNEYLKQLGFVVDQVIEIVNAFEPYLAYINPQSMIAATYPTCLENAKDALAGGAVMNGSIIEFGFIADIADSLAAIKKYVFDERILTLSEFRTILDDDFNGNETFRRKLLSDRDKYGNNKEIPDNIAKAISEYLVSKVCGRPNAENRGGVWNLGFHVARQSYTQGEKTASSPNGRLKGEELSKNLSASMGMNREGATAAILTVTKIDATSFTNDACLDLGLLPSAVKGDDGLEAMYALLMTFAKKGGHAMHINVFDADTLRAAQREPEKYRDLQIRVCGWNVLFNNINKEEQEGFIKQAEGLV